MILLLYCFKLFNCFYYRVSLLHVFFFEPKGLIWHHHVVLLSVRVSVCPPDCNAAHTGVEVEVDKMSTANLNYLGIYIVSSLSCKCSLNVPQTFAFLI